MAKPLWRETAKFSFSQLLSLMNNRQPAVGWSELHSSIPVSKRRLNAVQFEGRATSYQAPDVGSSTRTGCMECMQAAALLHS